MPVIRIDNLDDPRLDAYARLTEVQLRNKLEPEKGIFIAESGKVIERALAAGMEPLSFLMEEKWLGQVQGILARTGYGERDGSDGAHDAEGDRAGERPTSADLPLFVAPLPELNKLTGFELTRGALGA